MIEIERRNITNIVIQGKVINTAVSIQMRKIMINAESTKSEIVDPSDRVTTKLIIIFTIFTADTSTGYRDNAIIFLPLYL